ncbi:MAG: hypothetical protein ACE5F6_18895 [Anaerolineae bacterium]
MAVGQVAGWRDALRIERPRIRNGQAIANQNTLIYVPINNLRALHRVRRKLAAGRSAAHANRAWA